MAHKTLVGGTAYNVSGGKSMVSGTAYNIKGGRTLVGGTGYNISFSSDASSRDAYAHLYSDGSFVFKRNNSVETGKTLTASYSDFENITTIPAWNGKQNTFKNVSFNTEIAPVSICSWFHNARYMVANLYNFVNLKMNNITDMSYAYCDCQNLTGFPVCGDSVTNMAWAYYYCDKLTGSPVCGSKVTNMYSTYYNCQNLTGFPVCGNSVTNMVCAYCNCKRLTGSPVCGSNVTSMGQAYYNCLGLTGSPVCGDNVTNIGYAYAFCSGITGSPVCGNKVTNMCLTYFNCYKLTGSPVCGDKVTDMRSTYYNCYNLTGSPVCGNNVTMLMQTYFNCKNIGANAYFYSSKISNASYCFGNKNNSRRLNVYVLAGTTTNTVVHMNNSISLVGANITWTNAGSYQYNTAYNIYIYPVANVAAAAIANGDEEANANAGIIVGDSGGNNTGGGSSSSADYTVASVSGASYGFALNSNGYYESGNKGQSSSAALCKVTFIADGVSNVYFDCINYGESNYDYGLLSTVDKTLTTSSSADSSNVFKSFKGSQSASVQTVNYGILSAGEHFVYVKYIKDGSVNSNNDSLQFKVRFE